MDRTEAELTRTRETVISLRRLLAMPPQVPVAHLRSPASTGLGMKTQLNRGEVADWCGHTYPALYGILDHRFGTVPQQRFAVAVHSGPFTDCDLTYGWLGSHVAEHDIGLGAPTVEIYLVGPDHTNDPNRFQTEIRWPIQLGATSMTELVIGNVTVGCVHAADLAGFYAAVLDHAVDAGASEFFASVGRETGAHPVLMFIKVPDRIPGKNTIHLDLHAPDLAAEVARAVSLGAKHVADFAEYGATWTTLADPEGNLFDIGTPA